MDDVSRQGFEWDQITGEVRVNSNGTRTTLPQRYKTYEEAAKAASEYLGRHGR